MTAGPAFPFRSIGIYTLTSALAGVVPFLLVPVLTRHLVPTDYGVATMFVTVVSFLGSIAGLSVHAAVNVRYFEQDRIDLKVYVSTCLWILLASTVVLVALSLLLASVIGPTLGLDAPWLALAVLCSASQFVINVRLTLWQVAFRPQRYAAFQLGMTATNALLTLALVVAIAGGWRGRVAAQALAMTIFGALALWSLFRAGYVAQAPRRAYASDALRFGLPLVPHTIGGMLIALSDRMVVVSLLGLDAAGVYASGMQIGMVVALATEAFNRAYNPWLLSQLKDADEARKEWLVRVTYRYFLLLLAGVAVYALVAPWLFDAIVGARYAAARSISVWIALGGALQGMYYMVALYIVYAGRTSHLASITLIGGALNVPLTIAMVRIFGSTGAAYAYALTQAVFFGLTWAISQRSHPMPWSTVRL